MKVKKKPNTLLDKTLEKDIFPHPIAILGIVSLICAFIFDTNVNPDFNVFLLAIIAFSVIAAVAMYLFFEKKLTPERAVILILCAGFVLRLCYVLYTNMNFFDGVTYKERQHDFYNFEKGVGHAGYINHFFENGLKLPEMDPRLKTQFYHPPLHHMISAVWMQFLSVLGFSFERCVASLQYLTLFYSSCCMVLSYKVFRELKLRKAGLVIAFSLIAFHPTFIILAGSANNDILSITFIVAALYNTIAWYKNPTTKRIVYLALSIALGMLTKLSVSLIAPPIAVVFLIKLYEERKQLTQYIKQYTIFGLVCVPLGLSYVIRNALKYDVPLTYVQRLSNESDQYLGNYSVFQRLFDLTSDKPFSNPFLARVHSGDNYFEYNPFIALIKTSLFGEYNYANNAENPTTIQFLASLLLYVNIIIAIASLVLVVVMLVKKNNSLNLAHKTLLGGVYFLTLISFVKFAFDFPHNCSQDFRYAVVTLIVGAVAIGLFTEKLQAQKINATKSLQKSGLASVGLITTYTLTTLFCALSTVIYLMIE